MSSIVDNQQSQCISVYGTMARRVAAGQYGLGVSIAPEWLGPGGPGRFFEWFVRKPVDYQPAVSKDLLGKCTVFSPETCVIVPAKFLNWLHKAVAYYQIVTPSRSIDQYGCHLINLRGIRSIEYFNSKEEAETHWREKMDGVFRYFDSQLRASDPRILPRLQEILSQTILGEAPLEYYSRRELRY